MLNKLHEKIGDELITRYIAFLNQRKSIIHLSKSKLYALKWLFGEEKLEREKVLIFHERIEIAEHIFKYLREIGYGTSSVRQWIQRMGRILRKAPSKEYSKIYVVFVNLVEQDIFTEKDLAKFERQALSVEFIHLGGKIEADVA